MVDPFSNWLRWDHTSRPLTGGCVETRVIPSFHRPTTFASLPISSIPFFFLPSTLLLLLVF
jgi:hypothetical protein